MGKRGHFMILLIACHTNYPKILEGVDELQHKQMDVLIRKA